VTPPRVVYDCNVYVQALINLNGPASRCVESAREGKASLFVSPFVLAETNSALIVSRDRHLLDLMDISRAEAHAFRRQFPTLQIIDPVEFLRALDQRLAAEEGTE
jgi:predicted nucleic acid-binding protein